MSKKKNLELDSGSDSDDQDYVPEGEEASLDDSNDDSNDESEENEELKAKNKRYIKILLLRIDLI